MAPCPTLVVVANSASHRGIGWAIRKVRKAQKRTLQDLADAIGSDAGNVSRIERGEQDPTERGMLAIAAELKVSVSDLWRLAESGEVDPEDSGRVLAISGLLREPERRQLLKYGEFLLEHQSD